MTKPNQTAEHIFSAASLLAAVLAIIFSAYQSYLMRLSLDTFREANRNERRIDACIDYLTAARRLQSSFDIWAGKVLMDRPSISNDLSTASYKDLMVEAGVKLMDPEVRLKIIGGHEFSVGLEAVSYVRMASFLMAESGNVGSRANVDLYLSDLHEGIAKIEAACNLELGIRPNE